MTWIRTVPTEEATGKLRRLYDRVAGPDGNVDNIMMAHSLRPHSMEGHMALYKNVLHHSANEIPKLTSLLPLRISWTLNFRGVPQQSIVAISMVRLRLPPAGARRRR